MLRKISSKKLNTVIIVIALLVAVTIGSLYIIDRFGAIIEKAKENEGFIESLKTKIIEYKAEKIIPSYEYLKSITVFLTGEEVIAERMRRWAGTGTVVKVDENYTYILTNKHVVGGGREGATIYVDNDHKKIETEIIAVHPMLDLAVVRVEGKLKDKQVVKGFSTAYPQDKLYLVGHHLGRPFIYGEGVFAGYDGMYDLIQVPVLFGNSGTGVCNKDGKLIGVVFAINKVGFGVDGSHGLVIDAVHIKLFLDRLGLL